jgi:hypothetical protein
MLFEAKSSVIEAVSFQKPALDFKNLPSSIAIRLLSSVIPAQTADFVPASEQKVPPTVDFVQQNVLILLPSFCCQWV